MVRRNILHAAYRDGPDTYIQLYQDPGQAGIDQMESLTQMLDGFRVGQFILVRKDKVVSAEPLSSQYNAGLVSVLAPYENMIKGDLVSFPDGKHDDLVDALVGAYKFLAIPDADEASRRRAIAALVRAGNYAFGEGLEREIREGVEVLKVGYLPGEEAV